MALPIYGYFMKEALKDKSTGVSSEALSPPEGFDESILQCTKKTKNSPGDDKRTDDLGN
jgi:hypothetical protein